MTSRSLIGGYKGSEKMRLNLPDSHHEDGGFIFP
jgi:hypothetical protein